MPDTFADFKREPSASHQCMHDNPETGRRCRARAMHNNYMCFQHRCQDIPNVIQNEPFPLPGLHTRAQVQHGFSEVASRLACNRIDFKRASLLIQALQGASSNLAAQERLDAAAAGAPHLAPEMLTQPGVQPGVQPIPPAPEPPPPVGPDYPLYDNDEPSGYDPYDDPYDDPGDDPGDESSGTSGPATPTTLPTLDAVAEPTPFTQPPIPTEPRSAESKDPATLHPPTTLPHPSAPTPTPQKIGVIGVNRC